MTQQRIFITGGSGYLGRNLIRHFVAQGAQVVALARSEAAIRTVALLGATPFAGDLLEGDLASGMQSCQQLIHAAADTSHRGTSAQQARTNLDGTRRVFDAAIAAGVQQAIHLSSESVLLDGKPLRSVTEEHPYPRRPAGGYTRTKGEAERIALRYASARLSVVALRPRAVWGRDDSTALPQLVAAARSGQLAWIAGGRYLTSTTHIQNLCVAVEQALRLGRNGQVYFIADAEPLAFRDFVCGLLDTQGIAAPDKSVPRWLIAGMANIGDVLQSISGGRIKTPVSYQEYATMAVEITLDTSKARRELAYVPAISRAQGLAEMKAANDIW